MTQVAEVSDVAREVAAAALERAIGAGLEAVAPSQRTALLEALLDWRTAAGRAIERPEATERLTTMGGKGRGGQLAKQLLALAPSPAAVPGHRLFADHDLSVLLDAYERVNQPAPEPA
jgi:hypothetical protein